VVPQDGKRTIKLMHTADIHLGDHAEPQAVRAAFEAVVDSAIDEGVDLVIIAGDLFDSNRVKGDNVDFAIAQLARLSIPVVILPGNHDSYDETSIYRRVDFPARCPNVWLITRPEGELLTFPDLALNLWGKPVVEHHPGFRPIADLPARQGHYWHVGIAHGYHVPGSQNTDRSSPILGREIAASGWDYFALGHVHPFRDVSEGEVLACYSGSPVRTDSSQQSAGYVVIVNLDKDRGVSFERRTVSRR